MNIDFSLDPKIIKLRQSVAEFCETHISPIAKKIDIDNQFPADLWPQLGKADLLGLIVPEKYGGTNLGYLAQAITMEQISHASASIALSFATQANLCINQIVAHGTAEQKQQYLPGLTKGTLIGALAMSEEQAGSDVISMQLSAVDKGDYFELNGAKKWITNAPSADLAVVYAKTAPEKKAHGISAFIIEKGFAGFSVSERLDKFGMRGSDTGWLYFDQCKVPKSQLLGELNLGVKVLMPGLDIERLLLAAGPIGIMQAAFDEVLPYVKIRRQFGQAIGEFELIQAKITNMYTELCAARAYLYHLAKSADAGEVNNYDGAAVYLYTAEKATQITLDAIQCLGGNGYLNDAKVTRLLRDAKLFEIGGGTSEIRRMLVGRSLLNEPNKNKVNG